MTGADTQEVPAPAGASENGAAAHPPLLSRADILGVVDLPVEVVPVREWRLPSGVEHVAVRALSGAERDAIEAESVRARLRTGGPPANFRAMLAARTMVDADGRRLFEDADVVMLGEKSAAALTRVVLVASRLSGIDNDDLEELSEGLKAGPSGGTGTD